MAGVLRLSNLLRVKREALALLFALGDGRASPLARLAILASLIYLISPLDIMPEAVPLAGLIDDLIIVPWGLAAAHRRIPEHIMDAARNRSARYNTLLTLALVVLGAVVLSVLAFGVWALLRLVS